MEVSDETQEDIRHYIIDTLPDFVRRSPQRFHVAGKYSGGGFHGCAKLAEHYKSRQDNAKTCN